MARSVFGDVAAGQWKKRRNKEEADLDITPMIDVTFLLLIFFMVTSTMQKKDNLVPAARYGKNVDAKTAATLEVKMPAEGEVQIIAGGNEIDMAGLAGWVEERKAAGVQLIIIKADHRHTNGVLYDIESTITKADMQWKPGVRNKSKEAASKLGGS